MDLVTMLNHIVSFILTIYGEPSLPRKIVQNLIVYMDEFIRDIFLPSLRSDIMKILERENITSDSLIEVQKCFGEHSEIFENLKTESRRFDILRKKGFQDYEEFSIGHTFTENIVGNEIVIISNDLKGIHVPLRKSLKVILEVPGLFNQILEYMNYLHNESNIIMNIIQADLWLKKYSRIDENDSYVTLPLFLFYDEIEVGNALGSHAGINKFGCVYASIACLPQHIASKLNTIIFSTIFYVNDKKNSDNRKVFKKLIDEINLLQSTGITITVDNITKRVKFQLMLILGDNLGLNGIFGFVESFKANFSCRICKVSSIEMSRLTREDKNVLRSRQNYKDDVEQANVTLNGIKESCVFHEIHKFHVTENLSLDVMHDVFDVSLYVMQSLIYTFINVRNYFSLEMLNNRIRNFQFGPTETSNKPTEIG